MNRKLQKILLICLILIFVFSISSCGKNENSDIYKRYPDATVIKLNGDTATINGETIKEYDYTWHVDPTTVHKDVKNAPAEYYTGEKALDEDIYIDHELYYYPELDTNSFKLVNYDGENEWVYYYQDGENDEYIFSTLPNLTGSVPTSMMHSEEEASENKVLHITKAGTYILEGTWNGQIYIDLGDEDENFVNSDSKVTVILNGVEINCSVAPGIVFDDLYECDNTWEEREEYTNVVDTTDAGANVIIADGTVNKVTGENIFRMLKTKYKDEESTDLVKVQKKVRKLDGAFYSYVSINIDGEKDGTGVLNITSNFEGLDSELHMTINGGNIVINSEDDGINVNEDNVSVLTINGGTLEINAALGAEGDGIDSNGYVTMNGGTLKVNGIRTPDSPVDTEDGFYYEGGTVIVDGTEETYEKGSVNYEMIGGMQGNRMDFTNIDFDIKDFKEKVSNLPDDATLNDVLEILGMNNMGQGNTGNFGQNNNGDFDPNSMGNNQNGMGGMQGNPPEIPNGQGNGTEPPEIPNN